MKHTRRVVFLSSVCRSAFCRSLARSLAEPKTCGGVCGVWLGPLSDNVPLLADDKELTMRIFLDNVVAGADPVNR